MFHAAPIDRQRRRSDRFERRPPQPLNRPELDARYVEELAQFVESRMTLASRSSPSSDAVGLAILTALNITDEYFRTRTALSQNSGTLSGKIVLTPKRKFV